MWLWRLWWDVRGGCGGDVEASSGVVDGGRCSGDGCGGGDGCDGCGGGVCNVVVVVVLSRLLRYYRGC